MRITRFLDNCLGAFVDAFRSPKRRGEHKPTDSATSVEHAQQIEIEKELRRDLGGLSV